MRRSLSRVLRSAVLVLVCGGRLVGGESDVGRRFPPERTVYVDPVTDMEITVFTSSPAKDNKIYETHPRWTADRQHIVFMSDRTGSNQYFCVSEESGTITQLTDDSGPGNACLSQTKNQMFYVSGRHLWDLDIDAVMRLGRDGPKNAFRRRVAELPDSVQLSGTITLDANGKNIYLGVRREKAWGLLALDLEKGSFRRIIDLDFRVGHCQAHPSISGLIMYCWETGGDSEQRMWIVRADGSGNEPFYKETYCIERGCLERS